jgi:SAM-dependent MidA family methyltransferase
MTELKEILLEQVSKLGPMTIAEYMTQCLLHPEHGYYTTHNPLGAKGDFITSPEISQMFGELMGLALAQAWLDQGSPSRFCLCELGPGRGTLMQDLLRATKAVPGFQEAAQITLVEASPKLREVQAQILTPYQIDWVESVADLPDDLPLFLVANEFFDCLPIRQFQRAENGWNEQMIGANRKSLGFVQGTNWPDDAVADVPDDIAIGTILETSSASAAVAEDIARRIGTLGAAIIIDYGDWNAFGDTFQALRDHQKVDVLSDPGETDLTAHVHFSTLANSAKPFADVSKMTTQGAFLTSLGIAQRAEALAINLSDQPLALHRSALHRLVDPSEMGTLFKVIGITPKGGPPIAGLET